MPGYGGGDPSRMNTYLINAVTTAPGDEGIVMNLPMSIKHFTEREALEEMNRPFALAREKGFTVELFVTHVIAPDGTKKAL